VVNPLAFLGLARSCPKGTSELTSFLTRLVLTFLSLSPVSSHTKSTRPSWTRRTTALRQSFDALRCASTVSLALNLILLPFIGLFLGLFLGLDPVTFTGVPPPDILTRISAMAALV